MEEYLVRIAAYFGINVDFRTSVADRRRLRRASFLPVLVLAGNAIEFWLEIFKQIPYGSYDPPSASDLLWYHLYRFVSVIEVPLLPVAVALLIIFSIYPVSRAQGSWALLLTFILVAATTLFALLSALPEAFTTNPDKLTRDWFAPLWRALSYDTGFLAIGYAFLAYRCFSQRLLPKPRRRVRVRRTNDRPREL